MLTERVPDFTAATARDDTAAWRFALADGALVLLLFAIPHGIFADGRARFDALSQLLSGGGVSRTAYSLIGPLFSTPLFLLGRIAWTPDWWCAAYNAILVIAGVTILGAWLARHAGRHVAGTFVLLLAVASMFPNHVRAYFGEPFTALAVAVGLTRLVDGRLASGSILTALGVANTPATVVGLLLVTAAIVRDTRRLRYAVPLVVAVALIVAESWIRRGAPFVSGYEGNHGAATFLPYSGRPGFSYPLFFGVLSILFSFGKGLLFFAPGLLVPLGRDIAGPARAWWRYLLWFLAGVVLVYAKWWGWYGGWFWGPRFFLVASIPASLAIASALQQRRDAPTWRLALLAIVIPLSVWVAIEGGTLDQANLDAVCLANGYALESLCWYVPEFSALWHPFVQPAAISPEEMLFAIYCAACGAWLIAPVIGELAARSWRAVRDDLWISMRELSW